MVNVNYKNFSCTDFQSADMQILKHHIYEYKKGVRNMVLHTMSKAEQEIARYLLKMKNISFWIVEVNDKKINVFFGNPECIKIVRSFKGKPLNELTPEQDFMLGIMLGYDRKDQFKRYLQMTEGNGEKALQVSVKKTIHTVNIC